MKLLWDQVGEKLYGTGVDKGAIFVMSDAGVYGPGVAWNGLTSVSEKPSGGESNPKYANNRKYLDLRGPEEYAATIEAFYSPEEFDTCDGTVEIADGVTVGQQKRSIFGFAFRSKVGNDVVGDEYGYKITLVYGCSASPSERPHGTVNESPEADTLSWEISSTPIEIPGKKPSATIKLDSTKIPAPKMALLEDLIYGSEASESKLPTPAEILAIINAAG